jgi:hypothetical protein
MAAKNVDIKINTTASGNGAKQAEDGLKKVGAESEKASKKRISAEERAAIKAEQAAKRAADAAIREEKRKTAAAEAEAAKRIKAEERAATQTAQAAGKAAGKRSQIASQVGFQVQDIAVQAQMGVQATTILAQQGSQLLGAFGPTGAIIGGILAIGAAATGVFMKMGDDTASAEEKAQTLAASIDKIAEIAGKLQSDRIDMGRDAITEAIELTKLLSQGFQIASTSEQLFTNQALAGINNLKQAEIELKKLRGDYTDAQAGLDSIKLKNEAILLQQEQLKQAEIEKVKQAEQEKILAQDILAQRGHALIVSQQELDTEIKRVDALREQKKELEKIAKQTTVAKSPLIGSNLPPIYRPTNAASEAQQQLASTPFDAEIKALDERITAISNAVNGRLQEDLNAAAQGLLASELTLQNVSTEVAGALERIDLKGQEQYITGKTSELEAQATANADLLRTTFEGFVPVNETQRQGLQTIQAALKDNQILANETGNVSVALQQTTSSATTAQNINLQNVNQLLQLMNSYGAQLQRQEKEIEKLKGRYLSPKKAN